MNNEKYLKDRLIKISETAERQERFK